MAGEQTGDLPEAHSGPGEITHLLEAWSRGDQEALDKVFPLAFEDLRRIAKKCFRNVPCRDLQPTELIGEIYATLLEQKEVKWECRGQFFRFAAFLMERFLLGYKRALSTRKRGGEATRLPLIEAFDLGVAGDDSSLSPAVSSSPERPARGAEVLEAFSTAVDVAEKIGELAELDPQLAEIARLRYLLGLTLEETAETLEVSTRTVARGWRHAKRFLAAELGEYDPE